MNSLRSLLFCLLAILPHTHADISSRFTTMNPAMQYHHSLNNPVHPVANPNQNVLVEDHENLNFIERFRSFFYDEIYKLFFYYKILPGDHAIMKKYFGDDLPPLLEIQNNMSMLFVGNNPIFYNNRPLNPNTITIGGGMHIGEAKPLPQVSRKIQCNRELVQIGCQHDPVVFLVCN
ncbi:hypothetical protein JTB14_029094 [Gonioctena quinquepunctata]|nr:hypothetical protein JTB14_029094 [Gonioctena quinquepunctata]